MKRLQQAVALHQSGELDRAAALYMQVLADEPQQFDAMHLLGVVQRQRGRPDAALELIQGAIDLQPQHAIAHCNLGAALQDMQRHGLALASFERALALRPNYAMALFNRANALRHLGRLEEAVAGYDAALAAQAFYPQAWSNRGLALQGLQQYAQALDAYDHALPQAPRDASVWRQRGTALQSLHRWDEALASHERALDLQPNSHAAHLYRANTLRAMERLPEALSAYAQALEHGGDPEHIRYLMASLGAGPAPAAPPRSYVEALFDGYAGHFEQHLQEVLNYQTPALLVQAALGACAPRRLDVLDLGCGTGLCGPLLRGRSQRLHGVDLSARMLEQAHAKDCYDVLVQAELVAHVASAPAAWDLLIAADVLVYLGDLAPLFGAVHQALRPGGVFALSVEEGAQHAALQASGRYSHSETGLRQLAHEHDLELESLQRAPLRRDRQGQIKGLLAILRRQG